MSVNDGHLQIELSLSHVYRIMAGNLVQCLLRQDDLTKLGINEHHEPMHNHCLTAKRYLVSPIRSKYRRQKGRVPKFFVIVLRSDLADTNLPMESSIQLHALHHIYTHFNGGLLGASNIFA